MYANSVDPDQTPRSAASDPGLHCLFKIDCLSTKCKYGLTKYAGHSQHFNESHPLCERIS